MVDYKRGIGFDPGRGGAWPGGMGSFLFKLWHGFAGCPGGKVDIHLPLQFCIREEDVKENFLSGKKIGGEFKIWRKLMECRQGRGEKK
jgi:hypothetical protein